MSSSPTIPAFSPDMNLVCSFLEKISFKLARILRGPGSQPAGSFPVAGLPPSIHLAPTPAYSPASSVEPCNTACSNTEGIWEVCQQPQGWTARCSTLWDLPSGTKPRGPSPTPLAFLSSQQGIFLRLSYPSTHPAPTSTYLPASSVEPWNTACSSTEGT